MLCKLRYSLTALAAIALVAASWSISAQAAQRIWSTNAGSISTRPHINYSKQPKGYIGRNDGYVQQSTSTAKPAGKSVNSVKGTKLRRGGTEREIMDKMMRTQH
jgi:hypothetical protein